MPGAKDAADVRAKAKGIRWYHTLELAPGFETPGFFDTRAALAAIPFPPRLDGKRCLDVGTFDGFWAFTMEKRGAAEVVAADIIDPAKWDWPAGSTKAVAEAIGDLKGSGSGFEIAREALDSKVDRRLVSIYDLHPDNVGMFDFIYVGSLLLHLRNPIGAIDAVRRVARDNAQVLFVDAIDLELTATHPKVPMATLDGVGRPWWWRPNVAGLARHGRDRRVPSRAGPGALLHAVRGGPGRAADQAPAATQAGRTRSSDPPREGRPARGRAHAGRAGGTTQQLASYEDRAMGRLDELDLTQKLSRKQEAVRLAVAQYRLLHLRLVLGGQVGDGAIGPPVCIVFEGWDASGKGGAIKRLVAPLDPRHVRVAQFAAPTFDEKRHHFLWRFWPRLPGWGGMAIFDRSWYGRVLVERVERFATKEQWQRAYGEIVEFERTLHAEGMIMVKFWMHLSNAEQLERFRGRERDPLKTWKLTEEDWRNRRRRRAYERAVEEMLERTDHPAAPWHVIEAEDKRFARVRVVETVCSEIERGMARHGIEVPPQPQRAPRANM